MHIHQSKCIFFAHQYLSRTERFYFASNFLISVIIGQTIAMQIIKIPDSKNQLFTPILSAKNPESINPIGIARDMILPVKEITRP